MRKSFFDKLREQPWDFTYFFPHDTNAMWEMWKGLFLEIFDKYAPIQNKKIR